MNFLDTLRLRSMSSLTVSRRALARVLRSLLMAELRTARGRRGPTSTTPAFPAEWADDMSLGPAGLGCDSLDLLSLAAAVNEMFHLHEVQTERSLLTGERFGEWLDVVETAWQNGVAHITFSTSGSTGRPKRCVQTLAYLDTEVDALASRWQDRRRVVALAPAHHIYGFLFTALLPDRLAVPCLSAADLNAAELAAEIRPGDLLVSFPESWAYLARSLPDWPASVEGVVSTAPCPADLLAYLAERGLSRMTEVYGSSETAGIAWRDAPDAPYDLMPQWRFTEPHDGGAPVLVHAAGTIHTLMDRVARTGPRTFQLDGRRDGMVQVGGVNVSPAAVADRLRVQPGVSAATVRLMCPEEGRRLKAFLVPEAGIDVHALRSLIEGWAAACLTTAERPGSIVFGNELPVDALGKAADWYA